MAGTAEKNNCETLTAGEVATRARTLVNGAGNKVVPRQVRGSSQRRSFMAPLPALKSREVSQGVRTRFRERGINVHACPEFETGALVDSWDD